MRRLAVLSMAVLLAVPAPAGAFPPPGEPVGAGDSWVVTDGHQDAARVTILEVRTPRRHGLMRPPRGKRVYLIHLRYDWVKGVPYVGYWDWRAQRRNGRWLVPRRVRGLKRLPITVLHEDARSHVHGWLAWYGPADPSRVSLLMTRDRHRWVLPL